MYSSKFKMVTECLLILMEQEIQWMLVDMEERLVFCWWVSHVFLALPSAAITNGWIFVRPNARM